MNKQQKADSIQELSAKFAASDLSFVVNCQGMTVAQLQSLRNQLYDAGSELQVAKNRCVRIALESQAGHVVLSSALVGQNAVVFAKKDVTGIAKILHNFAKNNEQMKVVAGCYNASLLDKAMIARLAAIPSREVLLAQLLGVMMAPVTGLAVVLKQIAGKSSEGSASVEAA